MSETTQPIGPVLDAQGIEIRLPEGHLVSGAVVIMRLIDSDGRAYAKQAWSDGMDWISRRGLIEVARDAERVDSREQD